MITPLALIENGRIALSAGVIFSITLLCVALLAGFGYYLSRSRSLQLVRNGEDIISTPDYYGWFGVFVMFLPAVAVSIILMVLGYAGILSPPNLVYVIAWVGVPLILLAIVPQLVKATLNARILVERVIYGILLCAAMVSIFATIAIVLSVLYEAIEFFSSPGVSLTDFLFGAKWAPEQAFKASAGRAEEAGSFAFGAVPLFAGTFMITLIAMAVAVPLGLLSAIFLSEYATPKVRRYVKPMLEILAGIPTVVYGFFAALTVAPLIHDAAEAMGLSASMENALAPGIIMGVMIIPFMSSLCDDVISSVPMNLRRGSMALGSTKSETIKKVVLPAALPGIISAVHLAGDWRDDDCGYGGRSRRKSYRQSARSDDDSDCTNRGQSDR